MSIPKVIIHPLSAKAIRRGHYWITQDQFTKNFPKSLFLLAHEQNQRNTHLIFQDPNHPKIKARLWKKNFTKPDYPPQVFFKELEKRIHDAISKRNFFKDRDNGYLVFGEADELPGLFIQKLGEKILIQYYSYIWERFLKQIMQSLQKSPLKINAIWSQERSSKQKQATSLWGDKNPTFEISEYGLKYKIDFSLGYDMGIYSDMAAIRGVLNQSLFQNKKVLNLYSYTGAFSLFALKLGAELIHSVDLSEKYLSILEDNLKLNQNVLPIKKHQSFNQPVINYLKKSEKFDLIISDPPSFSSDGKKSQSAIKQYEKELPLIFEKLNRNGYALIFLNTHQTASSKFEEKIKNILKDKSFSITKRFSLIEDCPTVKGFSEGDYIKGILLKKN